MSIDIVLNRNMLPPKTRRQWPEEVKQKIIREASAPDANLTMIANKYDVSASMICNWRRRSQVAAVANTGYTIDSTVPLPVQNTRNRVGFPWAEMKVGDSFFAAGYVTRGSDRTGKIMATHHARKVHPGSSWVVREEARNGIWGVRVWRSA